MLQFYSLISSILMIVLLGCSFQTNEEITKENMINNESQTVEITSTNNLQKNKNDKINASLIASFDKEFPADVFVFNEIIYLLHHSNEIPLSIVDIKSNNRENLTNINKVLSQKFSQHEGVKQLYVSNDGIYVACQKAIFLFGHDGKLISEVYIEKFLNFFAIFNDKPYFVSLNSVNEVDFDKGGIINRIPLNDRRYKRWESNSNSLFNVSSPPTINEFKTESFKHERVFKLEDVEQYEDVYVGEIYESEIFGFPYFQRDKIGIWNIAGDFVKSIHLDIDLTPINEILTEEEGTPYFKIVAIQESKLFLIATSFENKDSFQIYSVEY